jgi:Ca2+-binding RTX toxin-like protein
MAYERWGGTITINDGVGVEDTRVAGIGQDRFVAVWEDTTGAVDQSGNAIVARVWDPFGAPLTPAFVVNTTISNHQTNPSVVGLASGQFVVVWEDISGQGGDAAGSAIKGQLFSASGDKVGTEFLVNTTTAGSQSGVAVAKNGTGFVVAWVDASGADLDVRAQLFDAFGGKLGPEFLPGSSTTGMQGKVLAIDTVSGFALAWTSDHDGMAGVDAIRVQTYATNGATGGENTSITTRGSGLGTLVDLARTGGSTAGFVVAYEDNATAQAGSETWAEFRSANGVVNGAAFLLGESTTGVAVSGLAIASYDAPTGTEAVLVRSSRDLTLNRGELVMAAIGQSVTDAGTLRDTSSPGSQLPTVLDAAMLQDARVLALAREGGSGAITVTIGENRPSQVFFNTQPTVVVGNDTGSHAADVLSSGDAGDTIYGLGGRDALWGYGGNDILIGGRDVDTLVGGIGNDTIYGSEDGDHLFGADGVDVLVGGEGNDYLWGENDNDFLYGDAGNDELQGGAGDDVLIGGAGNDTVLGREGNDYLYGGSGTNLLQADSGVDVLISEGFNDTMHAGGSEGDYLYAYGSGLTEALGGNGNDVFVMQSSAAVARGGFGQDYFYMGAFNDSMSGGAGVDVLQGGGGTDTYDGGAGTDYLFLGSGSDTVVMNLQSGVDVVNDFNVTQDFLRLQGTGFTSFAQVQAATTDYGSFSVITVDANTAIWLIGVSPAQLTGSNVLFT